MVTTTTGTAQPQPLASEGVDYRRLLWAAPLAAVVAAVANAILYFIGDALGAFPDSVTVAGDRPMSVAPVIISSIVGVLGGAAVSALIGRFARRPISVFRVVAGVVLLLSFAQPFFIAGAGFGYRAGLILMHVVAAAIAVGMLTTLARRA